MLSYEEIYIKVKELLSEKRFYHSICVVERCIEYAKIYNVDVEKMKIAGIAHDIAKEFSRNKMLQLSEKYDVELDEIEKKHISLIHSKLGAEIAKRDFGCTEDICEAIKWHTTGKEDMSIMEKILFMADATGKDRKYDNTKYLYNLAKTNLDAAVRDLLKDCIKEVLDRNIVVHPNSIKAFNYLVKNK